MTAARRPVRSLPGLARGLAARWWPQLVALAAACAVVATSITGALGVGDVIQGGLRRLALGRLGRIDAAVLGDGFFRRGLATDLAAAGTEPPRLACIPGLVLPVTLTGTSVTAAAARASLLACDDPAGLGFDPPPPPLEPGGLVINRRLATILDARVGDALVLRLPKRSAVPADSPLGRRTPESVGRRLRVTAVVADEGLGRFSLRPTQAAEPLAVVSLTDAQAILREGDVVNAVFVIAPGMAMRDDLVASIRARLQPQLDDLGVVVEPLAAEAGTAASKPTVRLSSRRLMIPPEIDRAAGRVLRPLGGEPTLAFLANDIAPLDRDGATPARIPYSTILGIDATTLPGGPLVDAAGAPLDVPLDDEIIINRWMADDLAAQGRPVTVGDLLVVTAFMPETIHGRVEERTESFRVAGVAEMTGGAVDRTLVPEVAGVTDEASIADWDPPFPFDAGRVRTVPPHDEDDRYWKHYRATPKAFVSLAAARRLAGSRFGTTTGWHVSGGAATAAEIAPRIVAGIDPERAGIRVLALRAEAEAAARGSTPFGGLFLALSSFVVGAGLLLVWLLFSLLVAAQSRTLGTLAAVGFPPRRLAALLLLAAAVAAAAGALAGAVLGPLWTRLLVGLLGRAWDREIVAGSAAVFAPQPLSITAPATGAAATFALALAAVAVAAARAGRQPPLALLRGAGPAVARRRRGRGALVAAAAMLAVAGVAASAASRAAADAAVALFFAAGFAALAGLLALVRSVLAAPLRGPARSLMALAGRTLSARAGRAFSIAAIVACGQFLVVAVSAFAVRPPADPADRRSPTGGWTTIATFGEPTALDPGDSTTRGSLGLSTDQERALAGTTIALLRVSDGDDASCTNLNATTRPQLVGVGPALIDRGGFRFVDHVPLDAAAAGNPWRLIERLGWEGQSAIPAVLDQATAQWGLKLGGVGSRFTLPDETGDEVEFVIVGLLEPGILQGRVLVSEQAFQRLFPTRSGYGMALLDASGVEASLHDTVSAAARAAWADAGVTLEPASARLRSLQAVQNTFLAGFQALGTLGLLLGTAGVAAVQMQGVVERLGGLAVLRAVGFALRRVRALVALETLASVGLGILAGTLAGAVAVWPAVASGTARLPLAWLAASGGLTLAAALAAGWLASARTAIPERPRG